MKTITSELASIKTDLAGSITAQGPGIADVSSKVETLLSCIEAQNSTLAEIKAADSSAEILAGIKASNDSHSAHAATLADLKTSTEAAAPAVADLKTDLGAINASLSEIKSKDVSTEILAGLRASNESHTAHTAAFTELKASTEATTPAVAELKTEIGALAATLSEIQSKDASSEILTGVKASNESHATHAAAFNELKSADNSAEILAAVRSTNESLTTHSATLSEIKSTVSAPVPTPEKVDLSGIEASIKSLTTTLSEIKNKDASADILAGVKASNESHVAHAAILSEIKSKDVSSDILAGMHNLSFEGPHPEATLPNSAMCWMLQEHCPEYLGKFEAIPLVLLISFNLLRILKSEMLTPRSFSCQ